MTIRHDLIVAGLIVVLTTALVGCQSDTPPSGVGNPITTGDRSDLSPDDSAQLCLRTAHDFEQQGYDREAIVQYERARSFDPTVASAAANRRLAVLYGRSGDAARATAEYDAALLLIPDDPLLLNDAGYFHLTAGDPAAAERLLRRAVAADPRYARAWVNLGLALGDQQRFDDSYAAFATVLPPAQARANVGVALARQGRYPQAEASLRQALSEDGTLPQAQVALRWVEDQLHPATRPAAAADGT